MFTEQTTSVGFEPIKPNTFPFKTNQSLCVFWVEVLKVIDFKPSVQLELLNQMVDRSGRLLAEKESIQEPVGFNFKSARETSLIRHY